MTHVIEGKLFKDLYGRFYIDKCASNDEHMAKPLAPGESRRTCRVWLDDLFQKYVDKTGYFQIHINFSEGPPYEQALVEVKIP